jgi:hypothetical protein
VCLEFEKPRLFPSRKADRVKPNEITPPVIVPNIHEFQEAKTIYGSF